MPFCGSRGCSGAGAHAAHQWRAAKFHIIMMMMSHIINPNLIS